MGALEDGTKELLAVVDGYRESTQSWRELLQQLKRHGLTVAPKLAIGVAPNRLKELIQAPQRPNEVWAGDITYLPTLLGTDLKRFSFKERTLDSTGAIRLVTVARLTEKKGLEYSIRAVAKLSQRFKKLKYNIIGDGDLRSELTQLIEALGVGSTVHLLGWKTQEEVQVLLDQSHVFVLASVESRNGDIEGLPMVLQEAQAMGLPVVCTRHSGLPEGILDGKSGFLVPERDVNALADCLADLISHPEAWPEMGRKGRAFVEIEHDLNKRNDALVELYRQLQERHLLSRR